MTTVLIVDDHPIVRLSLRMLLERERFRVVGEVGNGSEVAQVARDLRPDVVILDIGLPGLDGMEVIKRLQCLEPAPKIMVLTGQATDLYVRRCLDAGIGAFVTKEEDHEALLFALKALVKGYSTSRRCRSIATRWKASQCACPACPTGKWRCCGAWRAARTTRISAPA